MQGVTECLSFTWRSLSFSVGHPYRWYLQLVSLHFHGRECVFSCLLHSPVSSRFEQVRTGHPYVKSHGLLKTFSHSLHRCTSLTAAWADLRRRAMERRMSSSVSSQKDRFSPGPVKLGWACTSSPVRREIDLPFSVRTSSAGRPVWLNPPRRVSLSSLWMLALFARQAGTPTGCGRSPLTVGPPSSLLETR